MLLVIGTFRLPLANLEAGREAMARVIEASRAESGCLGYAYAEDVLEPGLFRVAEAWTDHDALATHFAMPHMKRWLRERAELGMKEREMSAYVVRSEEVL